ncbi:hypothetical protein F5Y01DRAFT_241045 [Xylaria sp. FL0043]|nr:hypothetical protein F5Y01DRAFT_241045 [Xylaria sp. FL0043]
MTPCFATLQVAVVSVAVLDGIGRYTSTSRHSRYPCLSTYLASTSHILIAIRHMRPARCPWRLRRFGCVADRRTIRLKLDIPDGSRTLHDQVSPVCFLSFYFISFHFTVLRSLVECPTHVETVLSVHLLDFTPHFGTASVCGLLCL